MNFWGKGKFGRRDGGPEFRSKARERLKSINNPIESFHRVLRRECLDRELFVDLISARCKINEWIRSYNRDRIHSSLGYRVPEENPHTLTF